MIMDRPIGMRGNYPAQRTPSTGSGRSGVRTPFGHMTVTGKAGDIKYVSVIDLVTVNNPGLALSAQAVGGDVSIALTLAPTDLAFNPLQNISGIWVNETGVTAGPIVALPSIATALRITFTEDAIVYLVGA